MKKGVIMEVDERFLTLLTPEGEFLKARKQKQDYLLGEEIDFFPISGIEKKKSLFFNFLPGKVLTAAAAAFFIATASFIPFYNDNEVYAYMSIDVNPSIELALNHDLEVVDLEAYNIEGKQILSEIKDWKHKQVSVVTTSIFDEIKEQGFLQTHDEVVISTVYDKKELKTKAKLDANIEQMVDEISKENVQLTVVNGTKKERKEAHKQGITFGEYKEKQQKVKNKEAKEKKLNEKDSSEVDLKEKDQQTDNKSTKDEKVKQDNSSEKQKDQKGKNQAPGLAKKNDVEKKGKQQKKGNIDGKVKKTSNNSTEDKSERKNKEEKKNHHKVKKEQKMNDRKEHLKKGHKENDREENHKKDHKKNDHNMNHNKEK